MSSPSLPTPEVVVSSRGGACNQPGESSSTALLLSTQAQARVVADTARGDCCSSDSVEAPWLPMASWSYCTSVSGM